MISNNKPLSMSEAKEHAGENQQVKEFIERFTKLSLKQACEIKEKISALNLLKLKEEDIPKIIDFLPEDLEDINKIFSELGLDEEESKKITDITKEYI